MLDTSRHAFETFFHIVVTHHDFWFVLVFGCLLLLCITLRMLKKIKRSTNFIVSNLSRDNILFSTFYTGLFLLFRKKTGVAGHAPPAPPLAAALLSSVCCEYKSVLTLRLIQL